MVKGEENILRWLEFNRYTFWKLAKREDDAPIMAFWFPKGSQENETKTTKDGLVALEEALKILSSGTYIITACKDLNDTRNYRETLYQHAMQEEPRREQAAPSVGNTENLEELVNRGVEEELERRDKENHVKELEKQLKEYKRKDSAYQDAVTAAIGQILPFVSKYGDQFICGVINALNGNRGAAIASPQMVGNTNRQNNEKKNDMAEIKSTEQERLQKVVERLEQIEPEKWLDLLEALVSTYDTNRAIYDTARNFLLK